MKVRIAFVTDTDGNPDVARIGAVEEHLDGDAKELIKQGVAAAATERDIADWEASEAHRKQVADAEAAQRVESSDLNSLTMDELRDQYPAAAGQPSSAKKADLIAAVEQAQGDSGTPDDAKADDQPTGPRKQRRNRVSGQLEDVDYADQPAGTPITTVAPGAESSPDVDPADRDK